MYYRNHNKLKVSHWKVQDRAITGITRTKLSKITKILSNKTESQIQKWQKQGMGMDCFFGLHPQHILQ